jgi:SpoVK/Ycf46/Vps4 family AAA+-type ATPase
MKKWSQDGINFSIGDITKQIKELPVAVYTLNRSMFGFYLTRIEDQFEFSHKLYGLETSLIDRIIRTWNGTNKNLGVLLNGLKGTGKTVTSKVICNELNLPVILVNMNPEGGGIPEFLNEIEQDVIVFIDEYEKIFGADAELLTVMDGVLTSEYRKLFLLTTNNTHINENLLQRPSRIRYHKTFKDLALSIIEEIIDDTLKYKKFRAELISAISNLEVITIDVVKSLIEEVNLHNESPSEFMDVFNVRKITGKYTVYKQTAGSDGIVKEEILKQGVKIYPREFDEDRIGNYFEADDEYLGRITEVLNYDTIVVKPDKRNAKPITLRIETYQSIHQVFRYQNFAF